MKRGIIEKKLKGTTMVELLVVMIVSGIIFLLLFDGLNLIQRYNRMLNTSLSEKSALLYSHQTMEILLNRADSVRKNDSELLFFSEGVNFNTLSIDSLYITTLSEDDYRDTIFANYLTFEIHMIEMYPQLIDSIHVTLFISRDTVTLDYGLSAYKELRSIDEYYATNGR